MSKRRTAIIAGIIGLGYLLFRKYSKAAPLGLKLLFDGVRLSSGKVIADFTAQNLSDVSSTIYAMDGWLSVNGNALGQLTTITPISIPPGSTNSVFSVPVPVSILNAIIDIADLIAGNTGSPAVFRVAGYAAIDQRAVPLDLTYQVV